MLKKYGNLILLLLFIYVVSYLLFPDSVKQAVEKHGWDESKIVLTNHLDKHAALVFLEEKQGEIRLASVHKGFFGWKIQDTAKIASDGSIEKGFTSVNGSLRMTKKDQRNYLIGIITDPKISKLTYQSPDGKEQTVNHFTTKNGTRFYYLTAKESMNKGFILAYSRQGERLYKKENV